MKAPFNIHSFWWHSTNVGEHKIWKQKQRHHQCWRCYLESTIKIERHSTMNWPHYFFSCVFSFLFWTSSFYLHHNILFSFSFVFHLWRSYECLLLLLPSLPYVGCHIIYSTYTRIIGRTLHHLIMFRICFWHSIGWQCQIVWLIRLYTTGWIDDFGIIFKKLCASAASICGNKMNCSKVIQFICRIRCQLNADRNHVSESNAIYKRLWRFICELYFIIRENLCIMTLKDDYWLKITIKTYTQIGVHNFWWNPKRLKDFLPSLPWNPV